MKEKFKEYRPKPEALALIQQCVKVTEDYQDQGLCLTLRQLYYQLVTKNVIPNTEQSYSKLSTVVSRARLAGMIDWDAIEDRIRIPQKHAEFGNLTALIEAAVHSYRLPRWEGQKYHVELWVEKDALAGVLRPLADKYHITLMVNRGYSSQSAMYESAERLRGHDGPKVILYLGDHDPSGEDMVRDIQDRMEMFDIPRLGLYRHDGVDVIKIGLTTEQVKHYNPPPNPAKLTDPRAEKYIALHGPVSWEVDALPPKELQKIVTKAIAEYVDEEVMDEIIEQEQKDIAKLRALTNEDS